MRAAHFMYHTNVVLILIRNGRKDELSVLNCICVNFRCLIFGFYNSQYFIKCIYYTTSWVIFYLLFCVKRGTIFLLRISHSVAEKSERERLSFLLYGGINGSASHFLDLCVHVIIL